MRAATVASLAVVSVVGLSLTGRVFAAPVQQPPTGTIATVTGTPTGPVIVVPDQVNVRTGPSTEYELIGVLIAGQTAPAIGRTAGGDWIQVGSQASESSKPRWLMKYESQTHWHAPPLCRIGRPL